jgi:hypothetical protein
MLLERLHPIPAIDDGTQFNEEAHTYRVDGHLAASSVTQLIGRRFAAFDADAVISKNLSGWRANGSKSAAVQAVLDECADDAEARERIKAAWTGAAEDGRDFHRCAELLLNEEPVPAELHASFERNYEHLERFVRHYRDHCKPFRTELVVFGKRAEAEAAADAEAVVPSVPPVPVAGMIDALFVDRRTGDYLLLDWKRTKRFAPDETAYGGRKGTAEFANVPDTKFHKYSLQLAVYAKLLKACAGIDVGTNRVLVRFDPSGQGRDAIECVQATCEFDAAVERMLRNEGVSL